MIQVRNGIFETNSSSTHAMVICQEEDRKFLEPNYIFFGIDHYGWASETFDTVTGKAAYLYTAALCLYDKDEVQEKLAANLGLCGIECEFQVPRYDKYGFLDNGGIDHAGSDDQVEWVDTMLNSPRQLRDFLLCPNSYIVTSNDNADDDEREWFEQKAYPQYESKTYYKGN